MKNEKIVIRVSGSVSVEEEKESVVAYILLNNRKDNNKDANDVYVAGRILWKAIGNALYTSVEIRDHEFCVQYF